MTMTRFVFGLGGRGLATGQGWRVMTDDQSATIGAERRAGLVDGAVEQDREGVLAGSAVLCPVAHFGRISGHSSTWSFYRHLQSGFKGDVEWFHRLCVDEDASGGEGYCFA